MASNPRDTSWKLPFDERPGWIQELGTCPVRFEGDEYWGETGDSGGIEVRFDTLMRGLATTKSDSMRRRIPELFSTTSNRVAAPAPTHPLCAISTLRLTQRHRPGCAGTNRYSVRLRANPLTATKPTGCAAGRHAIGPHRISPSARESGATSIPQAPETDCLASRPRKPIAGTSFEKLQLEPARENKTAM